MGGALTRHQTISTTQDGRGTSLGGPIQRHFCSLRDTVFSSSDAKPILPENPFSVEWTREALHAVVAQGVNHITQVGLSHIPSLRHLMSMILSGLFAVGCAPRLGVGKSFNRAAG